MTAPHVPVLLEEVLAALSPRPGDIIIDATFGAGGYTRALLDAGATVHGFDRDPTAIEAVRDNADAWPELAGEDPRLVLHPRRFSEMTAAMADAGVSRVDGVVMDIGVSSMQLDRAERGFAFSLGRAIRRPYILAKTTKTKNARNEIPCHHACAV